MQQKQDFDVQIRFQHPFPFIKYSFIKGTTSLWTDRKVFIDSNVKFSNLNFIEWNKKAMHWNACYVSLFTYTSFCTKTDSKKLCIQMVVAFKKKVIKYSQDNAYWIPLMEVGSVWTQRASPTKAHKIDSDCFVSLFFSELKEQL